MNKEQYHEERGESRSSKNYQKIILEGKKPFKNPAGTCLGAIVLLLTSLIVILTLLYLL